MRITTRQREAVVSFGMFLLLLFLGQFVCAQSEENPIGHERHTFKHGTNHASEAADESRFTTSRQSEVSFALPKEEESFSFIVYGDRTSGVPSGLRYLADAVQETNRIEPDFVINVGDMVQGYNTSEAWLAQKDQYKAVMNELKCPWFPVAGNHDVYWRGDNRPAKEHEEDYEKHFGPLWYTFEHKNCWFIALFTDEGNPETNEKNFRKEECQIMSEAQFSWLKDTLVKAKDARHVFVFMHQPRWRGGNYGNDWDRVHRLLKDNGNVSVVFAGHIHAITHQERDGIEYSTLATTGGNLNATAFEGAGYMHHFNLITVRQDRVGMVIIPVASTYDPREMARSRLNGILNLYQRSYSASGTLNVPENGGVDTEIVFPFKNTTTQPLEISVKITTEDSRWDFEREPQKLRVEPDTTVEPRFTLKRKPDTLDEAFRAPELELNIRYLGEGKEVVIPPVKAKIPMELL